jgi:hypothetical protein
MQGDAMATWDSMLSAALGGLIGVTGTVLGSRMQAREAGRVRAEQHDREDRFRLHKERIDAYSAFYIAAGHARRVLSGQPSGTMAADVRAEVWHAYTRVLLVGHRRVLDVADEILVYTTAVAFKGVSFDLDQYRGLISRLQHATRLDLIGADESEPNEQ